MTGYELSRQWFDFAFENPEKITPTHGMIYFFAIETWNRLGQKEKFGFPSYHCMEAIGIKSRNTFYTSFSDLVKWGLIQVVSKSENQNTANIISLSLVQNLCKRDASDRTALDQATGQHECKREASGGTIIKQINKKTKKQENKETMSEKDFEEFWINYPRNENKKKARDKFLTLPLSLKENILSALEAQKRAWDDPKFIPHPTTWLNGERWEDIAPIPDNKKSVPELLEKFSLSELGIELMDEKKYSDGDIKRIKREAQVMRRNGDETAKKLCEILLTY